MTVWPMKCRWPPDVAAVGLDDGREGVGTGGTETGVDITRVAMLTTQENLAGAIATLQTMHMWALPAVGAFRQ